MKTVLGLNLYDIKEVAEMLSVTTTSIHNYIRRKLLIGQKIGGRWYVSEENVRAFVSGGTEPRNRD
jgi:predicted site-specific integrase-resolvase